MLKANVRPSGSTARQQKEENDAEDDVDHDDEIGYSVPKLDISSFDQGEVENSIEVVIEKEKEKFKFDDGISTISDDDERILDKESCLPSNIPPLLKIGRGSIPKNVHSLVDSLSPSVSVSEGKAEVLRAQMGDGIQSIRHYRTSAGIAHFKWVHRNAFGEPEGNEDLEIDSSSSLALDERSLLEHPMKEFEDYDFLDTPSNPSPDDVSAIPLGEFPPTRTAEDDLAMILKIADGVTEQEINEEEYRQEEMNYQRSLREEKIMEALRLQKLQRVVNDFDSDIAGNEEEEAEEEAEDVMSTFALSPSEKAATASAIDYSLDPQEYPDIESIPPELLDVRRYSQKQRSQLILESKSAKEKAAELAKSGAGSLVESGAKSALKQTTIFGGKTTLRVVAAGGGETMGALAGPVTSAALEAAFEYRDSRNKKKALAVAGGASAGSAVGTAVGTVAGAVVNPIVGLATGIVASTAFGYAGGRAAKTAVNIHEGHAGGIRTEEELQDRARRRKVAKKIVKYSHYDEEDDMDVISLNSDEDIDNVVNEDGTVMCDGVEVSVEDGALRAYPRLMHLDNDNNNDNETTNG